MSDKKENLRCTIRVSACTGGGDPETPGYWDTHNHEILIDILDQGSKEENEKSVLKKLYEGEFTIELDEEQLGIEDLEKIFNKKSVIKAVEDASDWLICNFDKTLLETVLDSFDKTVLETVLDSLQSSVYDLCWDIYVTTYSKEDDEDDEDGNHWDYPNNINEEAFYDVMKGLGSDIVFEVEESRIPEASQPGVSMVARFGILRDSILKDEEDEG
jgi:hypothetical protein